MHYLVIQAGEVNCLPACETECIQEKYMFIRYFSKVYSKIRYRYVVCFSSCEHARQQSLGECMSGVKMEKPASMIKWLYPVAQFTHTLL